MNDLAAKMAAGPPKKPVGLVKKPTLDAAAAGASATPSEAEKKLGEVLRATVPTKTDGNLANDDKEQ